MIEDHDLLEAELASLRPHDASPDLRQRIAYYRTHHMPAGSRWRWGLVVAGGLAAACVAAAILVKWPGGQRVELQPIAVGPTPPRVDVDDSGPTLLAYQRALARSPEELDALLSKHALIAPESNPALVRMCAFTRSNSTLQALLGDD